MIDIQRFLDKVKDDYVKEVVIVDSHISINSRKVPYSENIFVLDVIYANFKPMFKNHFIKGGNSKEFLLLVGFLIANISF